ncbi:MAG TPA: TadE/TadG family type IV pilus assembly protein [Vicinamibacterales bacterium]|nr:TadE/TadG family type IV pilus assembly protein [Vicinamibacterales bacterium]
MAAMSSLRPRLKSERGAEIIELALVTPLLLILLGAIVDFGFVFRSWEVLTNASREGARVGVLPDYSCTAGGGGDVEPRVNQYLAAAGISGATVEVAETTTGGFTTCNVRVSMFQQLPSLGVFGRFFGGNFTSVYVAAGSSMRSEEQP